MTYRDRIFEKVEITEPVILDLINSPSLQRLKGVDQIGHYEPYVPGSSHSRFEHSMGVYVLLKKYNASLEEQIAGLIHDVSHSAFSHIIEYVLDTGKEKDQSHQDDIHEEYVLNSEIPDILKKYKIDPHFILNDKNFPLKENKIPDLCADRIDYFLRNSLIFREVDNDFHKRALKNLIIKDNKWVFKNIGIAHEYANLFLKMNRKHYSGSNAVVMYKVMADLLKYALKKGYINKDDLYKTDSHIWNLIRKKLEKDRELKKLFDRANRKVKFKNDPSDYEMHMYVKSRIVDPLFLEKGKIKRLSDIYKPWKAIVEKNMKPKEFFLKLLD